MYITFKDLLNRITDRPVTGIYLASARQAACTTLGISDHCYLTYKGIEVLPPGCKFQRGFEVLPCDPVAEADIDKYLTFQLEGQIYTIPVCKLVHPLDVLDPDA
jgi:hypothetical protein